MVVSSGAASLEVRNQGLSRVGYGYYCCSFSGLCFVHLVPLFQVQGEREGISCKLVVDASTLEPERMRQVGGDGFRKFGNSVVAHPYP